MDNDLEEQIDTLIKKATKDLKTRLLRVVGKHQTKLLKEQARDLKNVSTLPKRGRKATVKPVPVKNSRSTKYDSDSDEYYSD
jgi:hypothetical protein